MMIRKFNNTKLKLSMTLLWTNYQTLSSNFHKDSIRFMLIRVKEKKASVMNQMCLFSQKTSKLRIAILKISFKRCLLIISIKDKNRPLFKSLTFQEREKEKIQKCLNNIQYNHTENLLQEELGRILKSSCMMASIGKPNSTQLLRKRKTGWMKTRSIDSNWMMSKMKIRYWKTRLSNLLRWLIRLNLRMRSLLCHQIIRLYLLQLVEHQYN